MLNTKAFDLLAGNPKAWDEEVITRVKQGESLTEVQRDQWGRGRRSAALRLTNHGYVVCYDSSLAEDPVLYRASHQEDAVRLGTEWANQDPDNREFYRAKNLGV